jgi:hypothetical protein
MKSYFLGSKLIYRDSPGCFVTFGFFFLLLGGGIVAFTIGPAASTDILPVASQLLAFALGMSTVAIGVYIIYDSAGSQIVADREALSLLIIRRGILRRERVHFLFSEIQDIYTVQKEDIDGDPVFSLRMRLLTGKEIVLTHLWVHNRQRLEENANQLKTIVLQDTPQAPASN